MKNFLTALALLIAVCVHGQQYTTLKDALKKPSGVDELLVQPGQSNRIKKLANRIDRFDNLQTVYIQRGFTAEQLQKLAEGLKNKDLEEVIVECDTLTQLVHILATLQATDKITLIEPFIMKAEALLDIAKLNCASLGLKSSTRIKIPKDFAFPKHLEEIEILSKQPSKNHLLVDKLAGLEKLVSVYISVENIASLPTGLGTIPGLKNLEIIRAQELDNEDALMAQRFRMAKQANECNQLVSITYNTSAEMEETEKPVFASVFTGFYFITEKETIETNVPLTAETVAAEEVFEQAVGFKPIARTVDVKRKVFSFGAENPVQINVSSGTTVTIPENAFTDAEGNPVTGKVDITYREIKTPLDMLMSGVPMAYDSGGVVNQFVSAGNFEILAFKEGEPLQLAADKTININFVSTDDEAGYNLYKLDAEKRNWSFAGTADSREKPRDSSVTKPVIIKDQTFEYGFDTTLYQERFANADYCYMLDAGQKQGRVTEVNKKRNGEFLYAVNRNITLKTSLISIKPVYNGKEKRDSLRTIKFKMVPKVKKEVNFKFFPEMVAFNGYTFYTMEETTPKEFRAVQIKKHKYNDIRIMYENGEDYCTLLLKTETGIKEITVDITQGESGIKAMYRKMAFARRHKRYTRSLNKRMARLNNGLEMRKKNARAEFYADGSVSSAVTRSLKITGLGVYNCDAFMKYSIPPTVITDVRIKTADSGEIIPTIVYVVDERINGLLTYSYGSVSLYKRFTKTIVALDANDNIYCIDGTAKEAISKNVIKMKKLDMTTLQTSREFAKQVGL